MKTRHADDKHTSTVGWNLNDHSLPFVFIRTLALDEATTKVEKITSIICTCYCIKCHIEKIRQMQTKIKQKGLLLIQHPGYQVSNSSFSFFVYALFFFIY